MRQRFLLLLVCFAALASGFSAKAISPYTPPEFNADEWNSLGYGYYTPGIFDYFDNEYPENIACRLYESKENAAVYWVEPINPGVEIEINLEPAGAFIVHAENPDKVWTTPIWTMHPQIFCFYQNVPEVMGMQGSEEYYGKLENKTITFPERSYLLCTMPTGTPTSNNYGTFSIVLDAPEGIETVTVDDTAPVYFDLRGCLTANPERGRIYIERRGSHARKVVF